MRVLYIIFILKFSFILSGMAADIIKIGNPFQISIDPMERLLLVNFEKDPDTFYVGFEPQVFDDNVNGRGHLIIGWRVDGKVDVYHEPGLTCFQP